MIPMSCPNCGRRGNIPPDKLNARLHCKKCDAVFHMDMSGKIVLGDPSNPNKGRKSSGMISTRKSSATIPTKKVKKDPSDTVSLSETIADLPKPVKIGVPVVAVLALAFWLVSSMELVGAPPKTVTDAAEILGKAAADGDESTARRLAAGGTEDDAVKWVQEAKALLGDANNSQNTIVTAIIGQEATGAATVTLTLVPTASLVTDTKTRDQFSQVQMNTSWGQTADGRWLFHATNSLAGLPQKPSSGKKK